MTSDLQFTTVHPGIAEKRESISIIFSSCNHEVYERLGCGSQITKEISEPVVALHLPAKRQSFAVRPL